MAAEPGLIPAALMSSVMVPIVTFVVTVFPILPPARRLPERIVALIDGRY